MALLSSVEMLVMILKSTYSDGWNGAESVKPLRHKMIQCFEALELDRESRIIWFRSRLQIANHLIQIGTLERFRESSKQWSPDLK